MAIRKHGKFNDHNGELISVRNEPKLAEFLDQLSSGGGVLQEDLECTIDGGVGGISEGEVFTAGTSLEDVFIALFAGAPSLSLTQFKLYDESGSAIGTGQSQVYAAGTELVIDEIGFQISDSAGIIGSNTGTLTFANEAGLTETSIPVTTGINTYDTTSNNTVGKSTSDLAFAYTYVFNTKIINFSVPTSAGGTLSGSLQIYHAVPAFLINVNETLLDLATLQAVIGTGAEGALVDFAKVGSPVEKVDANGDYTGTWANTQADWSTNSNVRHYFLIPGMAGATPTDINYTIGGIPSSGDFTSVGLYNLDVTSAGWNLIDDSGATSVPYRVYAWNNLSSITSVSSPIELS